MSGVRDDIVNSQILAGVIGTSPTIINTGGKLWAARVAHNQRIRVDGEWKTKTWWLDVKAWGDEAQRLEGYLQKGDKAILIGYLDYEQYVNKAGQKRGTHLMKVVTARKHDATRGDLVNATVLSGVICTEPAMHHFKSHLCRFRLVQNRRMNVKGRWETRPLFINVEVWGDRADRYYERIGKGDKVVVVGFLDWEEWGEGSEHEKRHVLHGVSVNRYDRSAAASKAKPEPEEPDTDFSDFADADSIPF